MNDSLEAIVIGKYSIKCVNVNFSPVKYCQLCEIPYLKLELLEQQCIKHTKLKAVCDCVRFLVPLAK